MNRPVSIKQFQKTIWKFHKENRRDFAWRKTHDPYKILVSEIMLQQTQTARVAIKYASWIKQFPTWKTLASASLRAVLMEWQGLGYNRRSLALKKTAEIITKQYGGKFPTSHETILALPGIGPYTAGAVLAFSYNVPVPIIETNIRTVFIYFFFKNRKAVSDVEILQLVEKTIDEKNPREWYYALMDYGVHLKNTEGNLGRQSAHYKKQSPFKGSNRELRSNILKYVTKNKTVTEKELVRHLKKDLEKVHANLAALQKEGFLTKSKNGYKIQHFI